jgi:hypothetical protein
LFVNPAFAQSWTATSAPSEDWSSIACSEDGTKLVAVESYADQNADPGLIYTSSNSGATWTTTSAPSNYWTSVATSADGTTLVAAADVIYISDDSGATWTATSGPGGLCVACSADGTKLVSAADGLYISANSGATWMKTLDDNPASVASSSDGTKLVAVEFDNGGISTSTNSGATWMAADASSPSGWVSVASSADGTKLVAAAGHKQSASDTNEGLIYTYVSIVPPPDITAQPSNQTVQCGANVTLSVTAAGTSELSYQWYFGTNALSDGDLIFGSSSVVLQ